MHSFIHLSQKVILLKRNDFLKRSNSTDTHIYWIESGSLRIFITADDTEQNIRFAYSGNMTVALDSFFTEESSPFAIQAIKKTLVHQISKTAFTAFIEENSANQKMYRQLLEDLILQQMEREIDLLTDSPLERYRRVLRRSPQVFQEIPNRHIANYLRMSPETLSRIKNLDLSQEKKQIKQGDLSQKEK